MGYALKRIFTLLALPVGVAALVACGGDESGKSTRIRIQGSDTMVRVANSWAEDYGNKNPGVQLAVSGGGSGVGIAALLAGTVDFANSSRPIKDKEIEQAKANGLDPVVHVVGYDGLSVIVHPDNPIDHLTMGDLKGIYTGTVKNWNEVGGPDLEILVLSRESGSGTYDVVHEIVAEGENFRVDMSLQPTTPKMVTTVEQTPSAIGYVGMGYTEGKAVKVLSIAQDDSSDPIPPSVEAIHNETYPIWRKLFMISKGNESPAIKAYLDYVSGPEGQAVLENLGYVPLSN